MVIYLKHPVHGTKVAMAELEAEQDERRHDQQEQQAHGDLGVLADEIKHVRFPEAQKG